MNIKSYLLLSVIFFSFFASCKKDVSLPQLTFTNNISEGTADANGEYRITGHISSFVRLDRVILTKEGQSTYFILDESTAKNKTEYDFSYLITGITANTYIIIDVYDQNGGKSSYRFLIKK
ncbi:MAG: hypothetical protein KGZ59_10475 [Chitinophagaceae bacterium]|nr:hypothetical protein [Chitinophagaceae bacterium]